MWEVEPAGCSAAHCIFVARHWLCIVAWAGAAAGVLLLVVTCDPKCALTS